MASPACTRIAPARKPALTGRVRVRVHPGVSVSKARLMTERDPFAYPHVHQIVEFTADCLPLQILRLRSLLPPLSSAAIVDSHYADAHSANGFQPAALAGAGASRCDEEEGRCRQLWAICNLLLV